MCGALVRIAQSEVEHLGENGSEAQAAGHVILQPAHPSHAGLELPALLHVHRRQVPAV